MTPGEFIRVRRTVLRISQQKLGEACGYSGRSATVTVQHWEQDRSCIPTDKLRRAAEALKVPLDSPLIP